MRADAAGAAGRGAETRLAHVSGGGREDDDHEDRDKDEDQVDVWENEAETAGVWAGSGASERIGADRATETAGNSIILRMGELRLTPTCIC